MPLYLESSKNPRVKWLMQLQQKSRVRKSEGLVLVEGVKEVGLAIAAGWSPKIVVHDGEWSTLNDQNFEEWILEGSLMEKVAMRGRRGEVIGIFPEPQTSLETLKLSENPLLIVIEGVEKPGNLGAILRTADAAGVEGVLVVDSTTDIFNPNVARNSLGSLFSVPIAQATSEEAHEFLVKNNVQIITTWLEASQPYDEIDYSVPTAFVLGSEAHGVSRFWVDNSSQRAIIPMAGKVDSMNVSVATAIIVFEGVRQRKKK